MHTIWDKSQTGCVCHELTPNMLATFGGRAKCTTEYKNHTVVDDWPLVSSKIAMHFSAIIMMTEMTGVYIDVCKLDYKQEIGNIRANPN